MRIRRLAGAFAASIGLHALFVLILGWPPHGTTKVAEPAIRAFLVAPRDDERFPGLQRFSGSEAAPASVRQKLKPLMLPHLRIDGPAGEALVLDDREVQSIVARAPVDAGEINRILKNEDGRWLSFSYDRLRHFGYRFDTY